MSAHGVLAWGGLQLIVLFLAVLQLIRDL